MTIEVIGNYYKMTDTTVCTNCSSILRFSEKDETLNSRSGIFRTKEYFSIKCPICETLINTRQVKWL
jgi:predicted AlkP superfamily phosphohydrolase/phosphomutase